MLFRIIFLIVFHFTLNGAVAQPFVPVKDPDAWRKKLTEASQKFNSLHSDFIQEKNMSMLNSVVKSNGTFSYKKENKVRLEYKAPANNIMVLNNAKMSMSDGKKVTQMDMNRSRFFQQFNSILTGSVNGNLFSSKDFSISYSESPLQIRIELKPLSKGMKGFLSSIVMLMDKKDLTAARLEMIEPSGDNTILTFSNKRINAPMEDSLFILR